MDDELDAIREKRMKDLQTRMKGRAGGDVIIVDQATFASVLADHPQIVVDFWAEWCGPCRMVSPVIEELAKEFAGKVTFGKCDTDGNQKLAIQFGISAIPTILLFSNGQMVDRIIGAYPKETIKARILRAFGAGAG